MPLDPRVKEIPYTASGGDSMHERVLQAVKQRYMMSRDKMSDRHTKWEEMEDQFQAYTKPTKNDAKREELRKQGLPQYTTIVIPYSLAMLLTAHTYWSSVFLGRTPIFQYQGRHGESAMNEQAVEAVVDYQMSVGENLVPLYIWLMDAGKYGLGVLGSYWAQEECTYTASEQVQETVLGIPTGRTVNKQIPRTIQGYAGNKFYNVRPQDFFPDPRVSIHRFQEGEFCGRRTQVGWNTILRRQGQGRYFNVKVLRDRAKGSDQRLEGSSNLILPDAMETFYYGPTSERARKRGYVELLEMTIEVVPNEWGFSPNQRPERWVITVGNDSVIIGCEPLGEYHNKFGFDVLEYEIEGYALSKRSLLEIADPLNEAMTWLFNTHMYNVRKSLNDMLIVDPSRLVMKDILDPNAGKVIRLKPEAYGTDVRTTHTQLSVVDITASHLRDSQFLEQMLQRLLGVTDQVMGMMVQGGRRTATEVRTGTGFGVNRLKTNCEYYSSMGFAPLAAKMLQRTQQFYTEEQYFRIAGDMLRNPQRVRVGPDMIKGQYDFVPVDGTLPVDKFALANLWKELLIGLRDFGLAGMYDVPGIIGWVAQLAGAKNFERFRLQAAPDAVVAQNARAGNIVPLQEAAGGPGGAGQGTGGGGAAARAVQAPGIVSGVGRVSESR
jgi:hypothetical protein